MFLFIKKFIKLFKLDKDTADYYSSHIELTGRIACGIAKELGVGNQRVTPEGVEQSTKIVLRKGGAAHYIRWRKNQFVAFGDFKKKKGKGTLEVWIRLGWFEDNILSKFTSMTTKSDVITEFRSLESTGEKIKDKVTEGNAVVVTNDVKKGPNGE